MDGIPVTICETSIAYAVGNAAVWEQGRQALKNYLDGGFVIIGITEVKDEDDTLRVKAYLKHPDDDSEADS